YDFGDELPDHSSLTRIRTRYGRAIFQRFFERVVELCQEAGLVWGKELICDATKVEANAALDTLVPRFYLKAKASPPEVAAHVDALFSEEPADSPMATEPPGATAPLTTDTDDPTEVPSAPTPLPTGLSVSEAAELAAANASRWRLPGKAEIEREAAP